MRLLVRTEQLVGLLESYLEAEERRLQDSFQNGKNFQKQNGTLTPRQQLSERMVKVLKSEGRDVKPESMERGLHRLRRENGEYTNHRSADRIVTAMHRTDVFCNGELEVLKTCRGAFCQGEVRPVGDFGTSRSGTPKRNCRSCEPQMKLF